MKINVRYTEEKYLPVKMYGVQGKFHIKFMPAIYFPNMEEIWI